MGGNSPGGEAGGELTKGKFSGHCQDRYKVQEICDKAVDDFLPALKFVPDRFVTSKMIKKLYTALYADEGLLFFDEDSGNVTFCCGEMNILSVNLNNINLDDTNYPDR